MYVYKPAKEKGEWRGGGHRPPSLFWKATFFLKAHRENNFLISFFFFGGQFKFTYRL